jgi:hypothetical protein
VFHCPEVSVNNYQPTLRNNQRNKDIKIGNALKFESKSLKEGRRGDADWKMIINLAKIGSGGVG